ncbi:protein DGCR6-like [Ostrea edulis]|uniref:protein DGCR6-like n=1 Tax=Ostrea edulis TaxID=37623 RepID=UPI0020941413|nr:protein DGCR6-like [Ostrea edulis]
MHSLPGSTLYKGSTTGRLEPCQKVQQGSEELSARKEDIARKENQQKRHYFYQNELQNMARELPGKYQQRMSYDLLSGLANSLLDGTVFEIVRSLQEVQQLEERHLHTQRVKLINDHKAQRHELQKRHKELLQSCQTKPHNLPIVEVQIEREKETMERRCEEEVKKKDMKIIMELDQKTMDQQVMLEKAGVPGFYVTNKNIDVRLQMYLLEFIIRLGHMQPP